MWAPEPRSAGGDSLPVTPVVIWKVRVPECLLRAVCTAQGAWSTGEEPTGRARLLGVAAALAWA